MIPRRSFPPHERRYFHNRRREVRTLLAETVPAEQTNRVDDAEPMPRRMLALRWHLVLLVVGALLPLVVFAAVVVYRLADSERAAADRRLMRSAQQVSDALDREIRGTVRTLSALAESRSLDGPDLQPFYVEARRVVRTQPA